MAKLVGTALPGPFHRPPTTHLGDRGALSALGAFERRHLYLAGPRTEQPAPETAISSQLSAINFEAVMTRPRQAVRLFVLTADG